MYDFIIFEHSGIRNHLIDLCKIAKMLKDSGFNIAIANVTDEEKECAKYDFPIIYLKANQKDYKSKRLYLKAVIKELSPLTSNFYVGSILSSTSLFWLKYIPKDKKIFLWALRSFFFTNYKRIYISRTYINDVVRSIYNTWITRQNKNIRFFVSNNIIREEFINLNYEPWRLIIREERTTQSLCLPSPINLQHKTLSLLIIGALREEKRIDLCINAIESINNKKIHLTIAGKAYTTHGYDKMLERRTLNNPYITRLPNRLSEEEYNTLISKCDYLILCDEKQPSCVTNGTMAEALLAGKPIIAPNYNPYKYVIEKYNVGLLYELHNQNSLIKAIQQALITSPISFYNGLKKYQEDLMYNKVISVFSEKIKETLLK